MFSVAGRSVITFVIDHEFIPLFQIEGRGIVVAPWAVFRSRDVWRATGGCLFAWHETPSLTRCCSVRVFLLQGCKVVELAFRIYCLITLIALVSGHFFIAKPVSSPWPLDTNVSTWIPLRMCLPQGL